jgi:hypothetical protein
LTVLGWLIQIAQILRRFIITDSDVFAGVAGIPMSSVYSSIPMRGYSDLVTIGTWISWDVGILSAGPNWGAHFERGRSESDQISHNFRP